MKTHSRTRRWFTTLTLLVMHTCIAHADKYNRNLPQVAAALAKAQKVYVLESDNGTEPQAMHPEFMSFVQYLEALGRFQVVTDARDADIVLTYVWNGGNARIVEVMDEATHTFIGSYRKTIGVKNNGANVDKTELWLAAYTKTLAGNSTAATHTVAATLPALSPPTDDQTRALLQSAKTVYLIDGGVDKKFPHPGGKQYAPGQLVTLFKAQLAQQGRYRVVDSAKDADVLLQIGAYEQGDTEQIGTHPTYNGGLYAGDVATYRTTYTPEIELDAWDAKTLIHQHHWWEEYEKKLRNKSADPRAVGACLIADDLNAFLMDAATALPCGQ